VHIFLLQAILSAVLLIQFCLFPVSAIQVTDDFGNEVILSSTVKRIVTLAPYLTELVYSAGAGERLIATVSYSDYPEASNKLPSIGDANGIDIEAVVNLAPDLVISWHSGNGAAIANNLSRLGISVFESEPDSIEKISSTIQRIGKLAGTEQVANKNIQEFINEIDILSSQYSKQKKVTVFYQFWNKPIYTIGGLHLISKHIELCGGENIFADQETLSLNTDMESVIIRNPAIIIASGNDNQRPLWLDDWEEWRNIEAVSNNNLHYIPPDLIQRHTIRVAQGIKYLCEVIEIARQKQSMITD
jgi:iron complex transport system substrate-binding protein